MSSELMVCVFPVVLAGLAVLAVQPLTVLVTSSCRQIAIDDAKPFTSGLHLARTNVTRVAPLC